MLSLVIIVKTHLFFPKYICHESKSLLAGIAVHCCLNIFFFGFPTSVFEDRLDVLGRETFWEQSPGKALLQMKYQVYCSCLPEGAIHFLQRKTHFLQSTTHFFWSTIQFPYGTACFSWGMFKLSADTIHFCLGTLHFRILSEIPPP